MLRPVDNFFLHQEEPVKSCLQFLRNQILQHDGQISEGWAYSMPFFFYRNKRFCYLWVHKRLKQPYIGIVDGSKVNFPGLLAENRSRMRIMLFDPGKDISVSRVNELLKITLALYK